MHEAISPEAPDKSDSPFFVVIVMVPSPSPLSSSSDRRFSARDIGSVRTEYSGSGPGTERTGRFTRWYYKIDLHSRLSKVVSNCQESWLVDMRTNRRNAGGSVVREVGEVGRGGPLTGGLAC